MKCSNCHRNTLEVDGSRGNTVCRSCGFVNDETNIVADISFDNTKAIGTFVSEAQGGQTFLKNRHGNYIGDSRQSRINKAYQEIVSIGEKLGRCNLIKFYLYLFSNQRPYN